MNEEEAEYMRISAAGLEHVEFDMPEKGEWNLLQQMAHERPELDERLVYLHGFINQHRREAGKPDKTIRETIYDLLEYIVNRWTEIDEDVQSLQGSAKSD